MAGQLTINPWKQIWLKPQATIRAIVNFNPRYQLILLSFIYGLPMVLNYAQSMSLIEALPLWAILLASLIVSPFIGILAITISAWVLLWTGKWIGGAGRLETVRAAVAWSNVPNVVSIALWGVLIAVFGGSVLFSEFPAVPFTNYQQGILFIIFLLETIVSIWGLVILFKTLSEVHGFSIWKALLNVAIPVLIIICAGWVFNWIAISFN